MVVLYLIYSTYNHLRARNWKASIEECVRYTYQMHADLRIRYPKLIEGPPPFLEADIPNMLTRKGI